jgi:hypothetical protein
MRELQYKPYYTITPLNRAVFYLQRNDRMELTREQKERLKQERLLNYQTQIFNLKMTKTAYEAVGRG